MGIARCVDQGCDNTTPITCTTGKRMMKGIGRVNRLVDYRESVTEGNDCSTYRGEHSWYRERVSPWGDRWRHAVSIRSGNDNPSIRDGPTVRQVWTSASIVTMANVVARGPEVHRAPPVRIAHVSRRAPACRRARFGSSDDLSVFPCKRLAERP